MADTVGAVSQSDEVGVILAASVFSTIWSGTVVEAMKASGGGASHAANVSISVLSAAAA